VRAQAFASVFGFLLLISYLTVIRKGSFLLFTSHAQCAQWQSLLRKKLLISATAKQTLCWGFFLAMDRTASEKVDIFTISYIILPNLLSSYASWEEIVRERYNYYPIVSNYVFSNATSLSQAVFSRTNMFQTSSSALAVIQQHKLQSLFEQLCGTGEHVLALLGCWLQFLARPEFAVRFL
jgi:hypothetical protein